MEDVTLRDVAELILIYDKMANEGTPEGALVFCDRWERLTGSRDINFSTVVLAAKLAIADTEELLVSQGAKTEKGPAINV